VKVSEIRLMSVEEIQSKLLDTRKEFMTMRFQQVSGQLSDTSKIKQTKRLIARYETILNEKQDETKTEGEA